MKIGQNFSENIDAESALNRMIYAIFQIFFSLCNVIQPLVQCFVYCQALRVERQWVIFELNSIRMRHRTIQICGTSWQHYFV